MRNKRISRTHVLITLVLAVVASWLARGHFEAIKQGNLQQEQIQKQAQKQEVEEHKLTYNFTMIAHVQDSNDSSWMVIMKEIQAEIPLSGISESEEGGNTGNDSKGDFEVYYPETNKRGKLI